MESRQKMIQQYLSLGNIMRGHCSSVLYSVDERGSLKHTGNACGDVAESNDMC